MKALRLTKIKKNFDGGFGGTGFEAASGDAGKINFPRLKVMAMRFLHYSWMEYSLLELGQLTQELNLYFDMTKNQTEGAEQFGE